VALWREYNLPVVDDLGSGTLLDTAAFGLLHEPTIQESIAAGADLVTCSGDKLLGGPQAGIIVGSEELIAVLRRHPLARALRVDKITLAGLQATLRHYLEGQATSAVPVWQMLAMPLSEIEARAATWAQRWNRPPLVTAVVLESRSTIGGGSLPGETLPTWAVALSGPNPEALATRLRTGKLPVVARIEDNQVLLDPRTVLPAEDEALLSAVDEALSPFESGAS